MKKIQGKSATSENQKIKLWLWLKGHLGVFFLRKFIKFPTSNCPLCAWFLLLAIVIWFASSSILIYSKVQIPCSLPSLWWACQLDHSHKLCFHLQRGWCHWHRWSWNSFDRNFSKNWNVDFENLSNSWDILKYFKKQKCLSRSWNIWTILELILFPPFLCCWHTRVLWVRPPDQNISNYDPIPNTLIKIHLTKIFTIMIRQQTLIFV